MTTNAVLILWQPVVRLEDRLIVGEEALARFTSGDPPTQRFRAALQVGSATRLDAICRDTALYDCPPDGLLFLNLHPSTLRTLASGAMSLDVAPVDPRRIVWELSESGGWPDDGDGMTEIRRALPAGSHIALDDVGEGHADMVRWLTLRPDWIKLGRGLIHGLAGDPVRREMVRGLARAAACSGCQVVGEGIERAEDAMCLVDLGVTLGQGFLFGAAASWRQMPTRQGA